MRVLITGMSATGKSALVDELRRRGHVALDSDDDGYAEPRPHGGWGWRIDLVQQLFERYDDRLLFFAGCSEEQALFDFDLTVLLTLPEDVMLERLRTRTSNSFGTTDEERERILADRRDVEPLLRATADVVVDATMPTAALADLVLTHVAATDGG